MPCPISRYHRPLAAAISIPACFQSASSAECVPDLSPRDTNGAPFAWIVFSAVSMSLPLTPAGSLFGPINTKSLYITSKRFTPKPSARNSSSCDLAWTNTTSASPRRAVSSAWPVPCAITLTSIFVFVLKSGKRWPNSPESCVEVVDATTIERSCASAGVTLATALSKSADSNAENRKAIKCSCCRKSDHEVAAQKCRGLLSGWMVEKIRGGAALAQRATNQKEHIAGH